MKKALGIIMILVMAVLAACGGNTEANDSGEKPVLKMATSADYPPFESLTPSGEFQGFDIDLAKAVADELGYELEIEDMNFDGLIGALQTERVDMVLAAMNADNERKQNVDFSIEYLPANSTFISTEEKAISSLEELTGKVVGVQLGSIQAEGAKELSEQYDFEVKIVDKANVLVQEILSDKIDVAYIDKDAAEGYIAEQGLVGFDDPTSSAPGYAIAFPKGSDLVEDVNKVLEKFKEDGTLEELVNKWELGN